MIRADVIAVVVLGLIQRGGECLRPPEYLSGRGVERVDAVLLRRCEENVALFAAKIEVRDMQREPYICPSRGVSQSFPNSLGLTFV